jgi:putative oxidoreductase
MSGLGLLVLRLAVTTVVVAHGAHDLFGFWAGPGIGPGRLAFTAARFASIGFEPAALLAVVAGLIQLVAGALVGLGLLTRSASASLVGLIAILTWKVHLPWGFFLNWVGDPGRGHGIELALVEAGALLCLVFTGAGDLSLDGMRARRLEHAVRHRGRPHGRG